MIWLFVLALALAAGTIGGLIGFGSSIILMPALILAVGPYEAIPIMAIAGLMANISRVAVWWREVEWRVAAAFSATAVPMSALGARSLVALDAHKIQLALALFFLAMIPARRWLLAANFRIGLRGIAMAGTVIGFLAGLVTTVGPINTPFFLAYGLVKGPFVSTEALASAMMGLTRAGVFRTFGILPTETLLKGVLVGSAVTVGSWLSKRLMSNIDISRFHLMMDVVLLLAAATMLANAL